MNRWKYHNILQKKIDFVGFHGQTIYHNPLEKISKQIGDGKLLSQLTKKITIYNFRQNDIRNGGEGAPLAPLFHKLIVKQKKIEWYPLQGTELVPRVSQSVRCMSM